MSDKKKYVKHINGKDVEMDAKTLLEGLNPALTQDELLIPGYNSSCEYTKTGMKGKYISGKRRLKLHFLTPYYEMKLMELLHPIIEEFKRFIDDIGGAENFNWNAELLDILQSLAKRLLGSIEDYSHTLATACSIIAEAAIVLDRKYKCEELTDEDREQIELLDYGYFVQNVPAEYQFKSIVLPQYLKLSVADMIKLFFSTIANYLSAGVGNLIQKGISSSIASTPAS